MIEVPQGAIELAKRFEGFERKVKRGTGIIEPGAFVEYQDGSVTRLGIVRSTQVEAGMPEVWQTLGLQGYA